MVRSVMGEVGGVRMGGVRERGWRGRRQVGGRGRSFKRQVHKRGRGRLIGVEEDRRGGGAWRGWTDGGGAFHGGGGA